MSLDCPRDEIIECCPICGADKLPTDEWPQSGTHCFTVPYTCGTELVYAYGHDGASYGVSCDGEYKKYVPPTVTPEMVREFREKYKCSR